MLYGCVGVGLVLFSFAGNEGGETDRRYDAQRHHLAARPRDKLPTAPDADTMLFATGHQGVMPAN